MMGPVLSGARRRLHLYGWRGSIGAIDPQPRQAGRGSFGPGIIDPDVAVEVGEGADNGHVGLMPRADLSASLILRERVEGRRPHVSSVVRK